MLPEAIVQVLTESAPFAFTDFKDLAFELNPLSLRFGQPTISMNLIERAPNNRRDQFLELHILDQIIASAPFLVMRMLNKRLASAPGFSSTLAELEKDRACFLPRD
jgi:hypothetical protein